MAKIGVILSGCGVKDGSEIHEAVLTLLYLTQKGATPVCMAPNCTQAIVVNHTDFTAQAEERNVLVEAARIARGKIQDIEFVVPEDLDGVILPGGMGAVQNICDFSIKGEKYTVLPVVEKLLKDLYAAQKPIGAICIAPMILAKVFGEQKAKITIGNDVATAAVIQKMGAIHTECEVGEICVDEKNKLVTTPAYMLGETPFEISIGIEKLVAQVLKMVN